jgi:hypothetical protein
VTKVVNEHGRAIVLENDILVSEGFLKYMNEALDMYENDEQVMHIGGYSPLTKAKIEIKDSTFFYNHTFTWGWATWQRAWKHLSLDGWELIKKIKEQKKISYINLDNTFETFWGIKHIMEGKFQSWNYFWHTCVNLNDGLCLYPSKSLVTNIGFDGSGVHCDIDPEMGNLTFTNHIELKRIPLVEDKKIRKKLNKRNLLFKAKFTARHYLKYLFS